MQTENRLFDDLARVASGALATLGALREEIEARVRERVERLAADLDLVTREEFEAAREMAARAREAQEALETRVAALEARIAELEARLAERESRGRHQRGGGEGDSGKENGA